jgi:protein associated with RNAse G/E
MNDEKIKILKMIEEGKITAEEGSKLLQAVDETKSVIQEPKKTGTGEGKWLRVKVLSTEDGNKTKVNVNIPIALVETGLKIGKSFDKNLEESMKGVDIGEILEMIRNGAAGKIVEVESDNGDIVEVYVE